MRQTKSQLRSFPDPTFFPLLEFYICITHWLQRQKRQSEGNWYLLLIPEWWTVLRFISFKPQKHLYNVGCTPSFIYSFLRCYLFIFREEKRGREGNINVWLPLGRPLLGTWPVTQACALSGNQTSNPLVCRLPLHPLSYTSQGCTPPFRNEKIEPQVG